MKALHASTLLSAFLALGALCSAQDNRHDVFRSQTTDGNEATLRSQPRAEKTRWLAAGATNVSDGMQNPDSTQKPVMSPSRTYPLPADVKTLDGIMLAVYDVISGPAGERDWNRLRSLFVPDARIIPTEPKENGAFEYHSMDIDALIDLAKTRFKDKGFYEREIARKVESFGCIAHVFSSYETRETPEGKAFERGVNSIQLFNDGSRWWVVTIYWDRERPGNPIPARYLP